MARKYADFTPNADGTYTVDAVGFEGRG